MCWTKCGGSAIGEVDRYWAWERDTRVRVCIISISALLLHTYSRSGWNITEALREAWKNSQVNFTFKIVSSFCDNQKAISRFGDHLHGPILTIPRLESYMSAICRTTKHSFLKRGFFFFFSRMRLCPTESNNHHTVNFKGKSTVFFICLWL